ncbi:hypothetical protein BM1_07243 [Bipolaris maydis]|nr:hypothetical protein BM1_07243 [Bipolaris maydis]
MSSSEVSVQMQDLQLYKFKTATGQETMCLIRAFTQQNNLEDTPHEQMKPGGVATPKYTLTGTQSAMHFQDQFIRQVSLYSNNSKDNSVITNTRDTVLYRFLRAPLPLWP